MTEFELRSACEPRSPKDLMDRINTDIQSIFCRFDSLGGHRYEQFKTAALDVVVHLANDMIREGRIRALTDLENARKECGQHD